MSSILKRLIVFVTLTASVTALMALPYHSIDATDAMLIAAVD